MPRSSRATAASKIARALHLGDLGIRDAEPAPAMPEHRVRLAQAFDDACQFRLRQVKLPREQLRLFATVRQELVQRRIEQPDVDREPVHGLENRLEVGALHREQLGERAPPSTFIARDDHLAHGVNAVAFEEHVLGAAQPDALRRRTRVPDERPSACRHSRAP